ncbi:MAG: hypothetical protein GY809_25535, partial [Planctomycetes bacterium]|nr:hypothetical protein [Planctomycetota bacterium]
MDARRFHWIEFSVPAIGIACTMIVFFLIQHREGSDVAGYLRDQAGLHHQRVTVQVDGYANELAELALRVSRGDSTFLDARMRVMRASPGIHRVEQYQAGAKNGAIPIPAGFQTAIDAAGVSQTTQMSKPETIRIEESRIPTVLLVVPVPGQDSFVIGTIPCSSF